MKKCHLSLSITQWIGVRLPLPITCEFSYSARDPFAVTLIFDAEGEWPVRWVFSRELLAEGLTARAGDGDVVLWPEFGPDGGCALWVQVGRTCTAHFEIPAKPVMQWLAATYVMVTRGQEIAEVEWGDLTQLID
ncbi:SsgA family sporulation/cell division regulator [Streptomyces sp. NPDC005498]|uniref:SsgA family sporulation/cell division regulator n=1 Tax=Streptomyces sp. NPDC005498 TaxID=3364717 RepID=UPI00367BD5D3